MPPAVPGGGVDVGFAHLPNQIHREAVEDAFEFTVMAVGQSGLGKSTLLNALFAADIYEPAEYGVPGASVLSLQQRYIRLPLAHRLLQLCQCPYTPPMAV